jgi:hypothetical protein
MIDNNGSLPGADRLAKRTGAIIIANGEAINVMRKAGVPEEQLLPVAGGERIPLFTKKTREKAKARAAQQILENTGLTKGPSPGPPGPPRPDLSETAISVNVYPSLHCLMPGPPGAHPDSIDTATEYIGGAGPYACTIDITMGMKYGLLQAAKAPPHVRANMPNDFKAFIEYIADQKNKFSHFDGGQLMFNFLLGDSTILCMSHLGGYEGVLRAVDPKPDLLVMGIAGRGNINGRPFDGSAAQCAKDIIQWLGEPSNVIWCLHDEMPIKPYRINTKAATKLVEQDTRSRIWDLEPAKSYRL